jgi:phage tail sheath gpL-like
MTLTGIPSTRRLGLFQAEFTAVQASALVPLVNPPVILAQKTSAGTATAGVVQLVATEEQAIALFGEGSVAHHMCARFLANAPGHELRCIAYGDESGATAASRTITVDDASDPTEAGTLYLRIAGRLVEVAVSASDSANGIAAAIVAAITADDDLPVTAAAGSSPDQNVVTVTAKCKGTVGNQITLSLNALGVEGGEVTPDGVTIALGGAVLSSGATNTTPATWVTALGAIGYDVVVLQDTDSGLLDAIDAELVDRWDFDRALDGVAIAAKMDSAVDLATFGAGRLSRYLSTIGAPEGVGFLTPAYELAAAYAGRAAASLAADPGAPLQGLALRGVWSRFTPFTDSEQNTLARSGIATLTTDRASTTITYEAVTSATSAKAEDIQVPFLNSRFRRRMKNRVVLEFPRFKLADDDQPISGGQLITTPAMIKAVIAGEYRRMVKEGLMQNASDFVESLVVERNADYSDRVDVYCSPDLIDQLRVLAMRIGERA